MPVRDAGRYLETCMQSIGRQTWGDFEVIAVDDGSRDGTAERLDGWARDEPRLRVFHQPANGLIDALNFGLARCRGALVARMDADDAVPTNRFALQAAAFEATPRADVVSCLVRHFPRLEVGKGFRIYEAWLNSLVDHQSIMRERFIESPIPHPSAMVRRTVLEDAGGYRDAGFPEDYDLWLRLAARGAHFTKVPRVLYFWRDHGRRLTRTDSRYAVERFLACKAHHLLAGPLRDKTRILLWGAGQTGRRLSKHLLRGGAPIIGCLDIDPRKIGKTMRGIPVHDAEDLGTLWQDDGESLVVTAVSSRGARGLIRARLNALGLVEARDYWCAA